MNEGLYGMFLKNSKPVRLMYSRTQIRCSRARRVGRVEGVWRAGARRSEMFRSGSSYGILSTRTVQWYRGGSVYEIGPAFLVIHTPPRDDAGTAESAAGGGLGRRERGSTTRKKRAETWTPWGEKLKSRNANLSCIGIYPTYVHLRVWWHTLTKISVVDISWKAREERELTAIDENRRAVGIQNAWPFAR